MEAMDRLLDDLRSRGATWEGCAVEGSRAGQCRVVCTQALTKKGQVIVRVPKEACLTALTASESTRTLLVELMQRKDSTSTRYAQSSTQAMPHRAFRRGLRLSCCLGFRASLACVVRHA